MLLGTYFLKMSGREDHTDGAAPWSESTLAFWQRLRQVELIRRLRMTRARIFTAMDKSEIPLKLQQSDLQPFSWTGHILWHSWSLATWYLLPVYSWECRGKNVEFPNLQTWRAHLGSHLFKLSCLNLSGHCFVDLI